jgi:hypothetical protein
MHLGTAFKWTWWVLQWPVVFALVVTAIGLVYYFAPDARQDWIWITPGSVVATILWVVVSLGFKAYLAYFPNFNETYGTLGAFIVVLMWFYLSGLAILVGAELNAEIEHASPYGKAPGEKVPGEKKVIGPMAQREYEARRAKGEMPIRLFPDDVNCDLDRRPRAGDEQGVRPSDLLIGAAVLLPVAVKLTKELTRKASDQSKRGRAA